MRRFAALRVFSFPVLLFPAIVLFLAGRSQATVLYNVDFEAPVHTVGANPTLGQGPTPRRTPTAIFDLSPVVVSQPGILDGQSLRFTPSTYSYRQVRFGVGSYSQGFTEEYPQYKLRSDLVFNNRIDTGTLKVFVDGPQANNVQFSKGRVAVATFPTLSFPTDICAFNVGERISLDILVDRSTKWWSICMNGAKIHEGPCPYDSYEPVSSLQTLRFSSVGSVDFYLDNVRIEGLPEPGTLMLAAGMGMLLLRRRGREQH